MVDLNGIFCYFTRMDPKRKKILDKADTDLHRLYRFYQKAAEHRLGMAETIRSATIKLDRIEQALGPARGSRAKRRQNQLKRHLQDLVKVQRKSLDVFGSIDQAENWLNAWIPTLYKTRRELLLQPDGRK